MTVLLLAVLSGSPFPLAPGTFWEYRESYSQHIGPIDSIDEDTTRFALRGRTGKLYLHQSGGFDPNPGPVEAGPDWIRLTPWTGEEPLPLPLEPGRRGPESEGGGAWVVEAQEEVVVPAGTFQALRCAFRTRRHVSILWIAPGVGVVRETEGAPGARPEIERVLLRWGPQ